MPASESAEAAAARRVLEELRAELDRRGITLPSLRREETWDGGWLVHLGGARAEVVDRLVAALREASVWRCDEEERPDRQR